MSALNQDRRDRLDALYGAELDPLVVDRHLAAIEAEIADPAPMGLVGGRRTGRVPAVALATLALIMLLPVAGAVASNSAVPGDLLYPVRLASERMIGIVVPDIAASNRVQELERLIDRRATHEAILDASERAKDALSDRPPADPLVQRLADLLDRAELDRAATSDVERLTGENHGDARPDRWNSEDEPTDPSDDPPASPTTTSAPSTDRDGDTTTTTREPPSTDRSTTTTTDASRTDGSERESADDPLPSDGRSPDGDGGHNR